MPGPHLNKWPFLEALLSAPPPLSPRDKQIGALILTQFNPGKGYAWPPISWLAERAGCKRSTVFRAVKRLAKQGWFEVKSGGGRGNANEYTPRWERLRLLPGPLRLGRTSLYHLPTVKNHLIKQTERSERQRGRR